MNLVILWLVIPRPHTALRIKLISDQRWTIHQSSKGLSFKKIDRHVHSQAAEWLALARYVKQEQEMALDAKDSDGAIDFLPYWQRTL